MSVRAIVLPLALAFALAGCGLRPVYSGGSAGPVAQTLRGVAVAPIEGRAGWLVANALRDRLAGDGTAPRYRVEVRLDDDLLALGIRRDDSVTRERRSLRARYQLVDAANGAVLVDATAGSDVGIDVVGSDYATISAENIALERLAAIVADQIVARLARYARNPGETPPPAPAAGPAPVPAATPAAVPTPGLTDPSPRAGR